MVNKIEFIIIIFYFNMTICIYFSDDISHKYNSFEEILKLDNYNDIDYIDCSHNWLVNLPELPNSLQYFICSNNNLSSLPELPYLLIYLYCSNNNIYSLPELPNLLADMYYDNNPIRTHIIHYFNGKHQQYFEHQTNMKRTFANKIGNWYLDCKYNPKYLYCRKRLMKEYEELYG